jgi:hypothetical protein
VRLPIHELAHTQAPKEKGQMVIEIISRLIVAYLIPLAIVATIWVGLFIALKKSIKK